jgi:16S rRNA (guanine1207-N2)-methyltransferase
VDSTGDTNPHYFDADPSITSNPATIELVLPDVYLTLGTDSGVFSGGKVDSGTRYLLREHPPILSTTRAILDLGCGYGPIALTCAKRAPAAVVWGVDVNNRALSLATMNAEQNDITNASFGQPEDIPAGVRFDLIISNPPIRIGKAALHDLLNTWLSRLNDNGRAWLVVQKHLGSDSLSTWLNQQGWPTERLRSRKGYRILETRSRVEARQ